MKQYVCFILTALVLLGTVFLSSNFETKADLLMATQKETKVKEERYILKTEKGHLAVFKAGENTPFLITETMCDTLPKEDQKNLSRSIEITGDTALRRSLEDYCS